MLVIGRRHASFGNLVWTVHGIISKRGIIYRLVVARERSFVSHLAILAWMPQLGPETRSD